MPLLFLYQPKGPGQTVSCLIENDIDGPILAGILNLEFGAAEAHWRFVPRFVNSSAMSQSFAPRPPCHMQRPVGFALDGGGLLLGLFCQALFEHLEGHAGLIFCAADDERCFNGSHILS